MDVISVHKMNTQMRDFKRENDERVFSIRIQEERRI